MRNICTTLVLLSVLFFTPPAPCHARRNQVPELTAEIRQTIEADWQRQEQVTRRLNVTSPEALDGVLKRGWFLVADMRAAGATTAANEAARKLDAIQSQRDALLRSQPPNHPTPQLFNWRGLYMEARWVVRELMFRHPALNFNELLFVRRHTPAYAHQCSHHVGEAQQPGADLCVLSVAPTSCRHPAGWKPALQVNVRSVLNGQLPPGGIGRPDLSFDGKRIVFPYAAPRTPPTAYGIGVHGARGGACVMYDVYEIGVDGKGLRRLTNVPDAEDTEPCYLPNGRIAFTSSRDNRYVECGDWALVFSLYSMAADGSDVRRMTEAKEGEWFPSVLDARQTEASGTPSGHSARSGRLRQNPHHHSKRRRGERGGE